MRLKKYRKEGLPVQLKNIKHSFNIYYLPLDPALADPGAS